MKATSRVKKYQLENLDKMNKAMKDSAKRRRKIDEKTLSLVKVRLWSEIERSQKEDELIEISNDLEEGNPKIWEVKLEIERKKRKERRNRGQKYSKILIRCPVNLPSHQAEKTPGEKSASWAFEGLRSRLFPESALQEEPLGQSLRPIRNFNFWNHPL